MSAVDRTGATSRFFRALFWVTTLASVVPLWCAEFLPFSDMPEQIAVIGTLRHLWDPNWHVEREYVVAFGQSQYLLYHVIGALLSCVTGSAELANRLLLTIVGIAFPLSLRSLLRALGRDERLAIFGVPAFWSRPLTMGFVPYVASVPAVLFGLALVVHELHAPSRRRGVGLAVLSVALFYLHANAYVLFLLGAGGFAFVFHGADVLAAQRGARLAAARAALVRTLRSLLFTVPSLGLSAAWTLHGALTASIRHDEVVYVPFKKLVGELPAWSHDIWQSHVDEGCAAVVWAAFAVLLLQRGDSAEEKRGARRRAMAFVPLACAAVAYVLLPYSVGVGVMLNLRVAVFVAIFAPLVLETRRGWASSVPILAAGAASLVLAADAAYEVRAVEREEVGALDRLLDRMPTDTRLLTLPFHLTSPHTHWAPWTFVGSYQRSRRGGIASFSFSELAHWPVHYREEAAPPKKSVFWTFDSCLYRNEIDGRYYDYVLARGNVDPFRDAPPGPVWRRVDAERDFVLYAKTGEENPRWTIDDAGPCESRRSLERAAALGVPE